MVKKLRFYEKFLKWGIFININKKDKFWYGKKINYFYKLRTNYKIIK